MAEGNEGARVLFIGLEGITFCRNDEELLRKSFQVSSIFLGPKYYLRFPLLLVDMFRKFRRSDVALVWFGDVWALTAVFIGKLLGKRTIIVAGGYDVANEPSIDYGMLSRRFMRFVPVLAFRNCDKILAVSQFIKEEAEDIVDDISKIEVVYNGIDLTRFRDMGMERELSTTIGNVTPRSYRVKGMEEFLKVVENCPNERFALVGRTDLGVDIEKKDNLELPGYASGDDLVRLLNRSKNYLQLSYREGFGIALVEAMACGCVPIVSDRGALPEVVGNAGYVVPDGDWEKVSELVKKPYDPEMGNKAKARAGFFDSGTRGASLVRIVNDLVKKQKNSDWVGD